MAMMTRTDEQRLLVVESQRLARHFDKDELRTMLRRAREAEDRDQLPILKKAVYEYDTLVAC